jgi:hypothetical protein
MGMETPVSINHIAVKGEPKEIKIESADLSWNDMALALSGNIKPNTPKSMTVDLDIAADTIDVEKIMDHIGDRNRSPDQKPAAPTLPVPIKGDIRFKAQQFKTTMFTFQPLFADIRVQDNIVDITLKKTELCGIQVSGTINASRQGFKYYIEPIVKAQHLNSTLNCFVDRSFKAEGNLDAKGMIKGQGTMENLLKSSSGHMDLGISDGHIYKDIVLLNVIKFLNAIEFFNKHILPEDQFKKDGLGFKSCKTHVTLQDGKLQYKNFLLDADQLTIIGEGEMDIIQNQLDFVLLLAPQKTVDTILGHIPIIGGILQPMASIPLRVTGPLDNIRVLPVAPKAVRYELKEIMEDILDSPVKLTHIDEYR